MEQDSVRELEDGLEGSPSALFHDYRSLHSDDILMSVCVTAS